MKKNVNNDAAASLKETRRDIIDINPELIDDKALEALCRTLLEGAKKFYEDPENVRKYEEWRKNRKNS